MFRYYEQPNVSAISPASGSAQGGTRVTVSGSGFSGLGGAVVCTFGSLRVGDDIRAGATSPAASITDGQLECIAPSAHASSAVGSAFFSFSNLPPVTVIQPCVVNTNCIPGLLEPERLYRFPSGHNLTLFGGALNEAGQIKLTRNLYRYIGSMVLPSYHLLRRRRRARARLRGFVASGGWAWLGRRRLLVRVWRPVEGE